MLDKNTHQMLRCDGVCPSEEPAWLAEARKWIGLTETKGAAHTPEILQMWRDTKRGGIKDDETRCAAFVGAMLERVGIRSCRFEGARSYLEWGVPLKVPMHGCIAVFSRAGGGHVGFVVGRDPSGNVLVLGGNQSDAVNVRAFALTRVTGYRWPVSVPVLATALPKINGAAWRGRGMKMLALAKPLALLLAGAALVWWGLAPRIQLEAERAGRAEQSLAESRQMIDLQAGVLANQQSQIGAIAEIERQMHALDQTITRNAAAHSAAIEELKRNDQAVAEYLATAVPTPLGRLYERPETTDSAAYRAPTGVPAGFVPAAGAPVASGK